jgi:tetratricopeptide (TPR) repeat protein
MFLSTNIWPSTEGKIEGIVKDKLGNPLEKVKITIISMQATSRKFELSSKKDGKFLQVGIIPGYYQVSFKKEGFMPLTQEIRVRIAETSRLDVKLETAEKFIESKVSDADKNFLKANKLYAENKFEEAVAAYEEAIKLNETQWGYFFNLGLAYKKMKKMDEAKGAFRKALELNPNSYSSNKELAEALGVEENYEEAKKYFLKATELSPDDADALYNLGVVSTNLGQSEEALQAFLKAVEIKEDHPDALYQLGTIFIGQNNTEEAIKNLEKFLDIAPDHEKAAIAKQLLEYLKK